MTAQTPVADQSHVTPADCPRFDRCGANVCPLDESWRQRKHLPGEPVCHYLLQHAKPGGDARMRGSVRDELWQAVLLRAPAILARFYAVRRACERAARSGFRGDNLKGGKR